MWPQMECAVQCGAEYNKWERARMANCYRFIFQQIWNAGKIQPVQWIERNGVDCLCGCDARAPATNELIAAHERCFSHSILGRNSVEIIIKCIEIWWNEISFFVFAAGGGGAVRLARRVRCFRWFFMMYARYPFTVFLRQNGRNEWERASKPKWICCYSRRCRRRRRRRHRSLSVHHELYHKIYIWLRCTEMGKLMIFPCSIRCQNVRYLSLMPVLRQRVRDSMLSMALAFGIRFGWRASALLMLLFIKRTFTNLPKNSSCGCNLCMWKDAYASPPNYYAALQHCCFWKSLLFYRTSYVLCDAKNTGTGKKDNRMKTETTKKIKTYVISVFMAFRWEITNNLKPLVIICVIICYYCVMAQYGSSHSIRTSIVSDVISFLSAYHLHVRVKGLRR